MAKRTKLWIGTLFGGVFLLISAGGYAYGMTHAAPSHARASDPVPGSSNAVGYPRNAAGQTYGTMPTSATPLSVDDMPTLVGIIGEHGVAGYVLADQLMDRGQGAPKSPEEALARQASESDQWTIPVYAADGKTVVDTFVMTGGWDHGRGISGERVP